MPIPPDVVRENAIFHALVSKHKAHAAFWTYIGVQSAILAKCTDVVDFASWLSALAPGHPDLAENDSVPWLGASGLAYFQWLYDVDVADVGRTDYHTFKFTRKADGKSVLVVLKTTDAERGAGLPGSSAYGELSRKLTIERDRLLAAK